MNVVQNLTNFITLHPHQFLLAGILTAAAVIIADLENGYSLQLPGRKRLGLAGITLLTTVTGYILVTEGVKGILDKLANDIFSALIIGGVIALIVVKKQ